MSDKQNGIFEKIENTLSVFLLILLCVLPFIQLIAERFFHIPLLGVEGATVNLVFLFACFTSIITWRAHKHICIAAVDEFAPAPVKKTADALKAVFIPVVLLALFFSSFSEFFAVFTPADKVWGVPLQVVFVLLPVSYALMLFSSLAQKKMLVFSVLGILLGCVISAGPISGVLYYLFKIEEPALFSALGSFWLGVSARFFPFLILKYPSLRT